MNHNSTAKDVMENDSVTNIQNATISDTQEAVGSAIQGQKTKGKRELWDINPYTNPAGRPHFIRLSPVIPTNSRTAIEQSLDQFWAHNKAILKACTKPKQPKKEKVHIHITRSNIPEFNI